MKPILKRVARLTGAHGLAVMVLASAIGFAAESAFAQGHRRPPPPPPHAAWRHMYDRHYHHPYRRAPPPVVYAPPPVVYAPPPSAGISLFLPIEIR